MKLSKQFGADHLVNVNKTSFKERLQMVRDLTEGFLALRSHYLFQSRFCNVGRAHEKGMVERLIGYVRRNFLVPIPRFRNWNELNEYLESA